VRLANAFRRVPLCLALAVLLAPGPATGASQPDSAATDSTRAVAHQGASPLQREADRTSVVGSRGHARSVAGSAHFLGPDIVPYQDQSFDDVHRLMLRIPGLYAIGEDGYGLRPNLGMRGVDPYRSAGLAMLEDGVPVAPAPYAAPGLPVFAGLGRTEAIETLKGPAGIKYGPGTAGGAVNFRTLSLPDDLLAQARLSLGSYGAHTLNVDYGDSWQGISWMLGTHQTRTFGFKALDNGNDTGFEQDDYLAKLGLRSRPGADYYQDVMFKFGYFKTDADDSYLGLTDDDFAATPFRRYAASQRDHMTHEATHLLLRHFIAINDAIDITTNLYRNDLELDWYLLDGVNGVSPGDVLADPGAYPDEYGILAGDSASADDALSVKQNNHSYFSTGIQSEVGATFVTGAARHELETGLRYHEDEQDRLDRIDGYGMVSGGAMVLTSRGTDGGNGGSDDQVNRAHALAGFVRDRIAGGRWTITPGLRVEWVETKQSSWGAGDSDRAAAPAVIENSTTAVLPGIGASWRATSDIVLLGGVHSGFSPPPAGTNGDGFKAVHYEAGGRLKHGGWETALIGFLSDHSANGDATGNASGLEVSAGYAIVDPAYGVDLSASYTYTHTEYASGTTVPDSLFGIYPGAGDRIPYVPGHSVSASLVLTTHKSFAGVSANYASRTPAVWTSGDYSDAQAIDARFLLDIVTEYEIVRYVRVFASVYNVTDDVYVASRFPYGAHPGAPRTFTAGLKLGL
jgi:Fe(3+) dicitrate transport protein